MVNCMNKLVVRTEVVTVTRKEDLTKLPNAGQALWKDLRELKWFLRPNTNRRRCSANLNSYKACQVIQARSGLNWQLIRPPYSYICQTKLLERTMHVSVWKVTKYEGLTSSTIKVYIRIYKNKSYVEKCHILGKTGADYEDPSQDHGLSRRGWRREYVMCFVFVSLSTTTFFLHPFLPLLQALAIRQATAISDGLLIHF